MTTPLWNQPDAEVFLASLVDAGSLSEEGSERAGRAYRSSGQPLDVVLTELGLLKEEEFAALAGVHCQSQAIEVLSRDIDQSLLQSAGHSFLIDHCLLPITIDSEVLEIVAADPFRKQTIEAIAFHFDRRPIVRIAPRTAILARLGQMDSARADDDIMAPEASADGGVSPDDIERLRDFAEGAPVVRFVSKMIQRAVDHGATDIHIEPLEDKVQIRLPWIGQAIRNSAAARYLDTMGLLLANGVPAADALKLSAETCSRDALRRSLLTAREKVVGGEPIHRALSESGLFVAPVVTLLELGEASNSLPKLVARGSALLEADLKRSLDRFVVLLTPAITIGLGGLVGSLVIAVMSALLNINEIAIR